MLVSAQPRTCSRQTPYPTRWRRAKRDRQASFLPSEDKCPSPPIKRLKVTNPDIQDTKSWPKYPTTIPAVDAPTKFGLFGGQFAPELQMDLLHQLPGVFHNTISDETFWKDFFACPLIRSSPLHLASNLTKAAGGANIWLKREDISPFGSYQTRNIVGQILFAHRTGMKEIVMDSGFAGHGLVCASMCARLRMKCTVFMGASDIETQSEAVEKMKKLGATVTSAQCMTVDKAGPSSGTLREATNEALRYSLARIDTTCYISSGTVGPHPLPSITRTFQSLLGEEIKTSLSKLSDRRNRETSEPAALISPVGPSGSAALGMFAPFISTPNTRLVAIEGADAAPLTNGSVGVMYGCKTLLLQDDNGQILQSHSIAPDMNFPCAGPELAYWKESGRMEAVAVSDEEALRGLDLLFEAEGVKAGLATGYAVSEALRVASEVGPGRDVVLLVSG